MSKNKFFYYIFSCIEIFPLLIILTIKSQFLKLDFNELLIIYRFFILCIIFIELVYLIRVKRTCGGYIGLPITFLLVFRYNIMENLSVQNVSVSINIIIFSAIILIRIYEIIFIIKSSPASKDIFSYKGILSSLMIDLLSILQFSRFY